MKFNRLAFTLSLLLSFGVAGCDIKPRTVSSNSGNQSGELIELLFHIEGDMNVAAKTMKERLKKTNTASYQVETLENENIKVSFVGNENERKLVSKYLLYDGTVSLSNSKGTYVKASEFLNKSKEAYYEITNDGFASVIIPINFDSELFKAVYLEAKEMSENNTGEVEIEVEDDSGEENEHEHIHKAFLYLWYNYIEDYYSYDKINQNNPESYDPKIASEVLMVFDAEDPFLDENHDALKAYFASASFDLESTKSIANYYTNIINAEPLDYAVSLIEN